MPVNPDDILVFKLRGMKTKEVKQPEAPAPTPAPSHVSPEIPEATESMKKEKAEPRGLFRRKPKVKEAKKEKIEEVEAQPYVEEHKIKEVENLERSVETEYMPVERGGIGVPHKKESGIPAAVTGIIFIFNALVFAYFIYPESLFVINYVQHIGIYSFINSVNFPYDIPIINMTLVALSFLSGLLMMIRIRGSHMIGGVIGSLMTLAVTYEYLNSNANYLFIVSIVSFISVGSLVYSRMASVSEASKEIAREDVAWPMPETF
ncbi:MAG: hypothetical protein ABSD68_00190 [Candidatus Micrarchaeales archaeon]